MSIVINTYFCWIKANIALKKRNFTLLGFIFIGLIFLLIQLLYTYKHTLLFTLFINISIKNYYGINFLCERE